MKTVVMLATFHESQIPEFDPNTELEEVLRYLERKLKFQIVMEEWAENLDLGQSLAARWATHESLPWTNIGTPDQPQFKTIRGKIRDPRHNGTLPWDPRGPRIDEYGPFENQENRENWMAIRVESAMKNYDTGLLIIGLGHMHSLFAKLLGLGLKVIGYRDYLLDSM